MTHEELKTFLAGLIQDPISSIIDRENVKTPVVEVRHFYEARYGSSLVCSCILKLCGTIDAAGAAEIWAELVAGNAVFKGAFVPGVLDLGERAETSMRASVIIASAMMAPFLPVLHELILEQVAGVERQEPYAIK